MKSSSIMWSISALTILGFLGCGDGSKSTEGSSGQAGQEPGGAGAPTDQSGAAGMSRHDGGHAESGSAGDRAGSDEGGEANERGGSGAGGHANAGTSGASRGGTSGGGYSGPGGAGQGGNGVSGGGAANAGAGNESGDAQGGAEIAGMSSQGGGAEVGGEPSAGAGPEGGRESVGGTAGSSGSGDGGKGEAGRGGGAGNASGEYGFVYRVPEMHEVACQDSSSIPPSTEIVEFSDRDWLCTFADDDMSGYVYVQSTPVDCTVMMSAQATYQTEVAGISLDGAVTALESAQLFWGGNHQNDSLVIEYQSKTYTYGHSSFGFGYHSCQNMDCMQIEEEGVIDDGCTVERTHPIVCVEIQPNGNHEPLVDLFAPCPGDPNY